MTGTTTYWNDRAGFGFIQGDDGKEVFIHYSHILFDDTGRKSLRKGDRLMFDVAEREQGLYALNVKREVVK